MSRLSRTTLFLLAACFGTSAGCLFDDGNTEGLYCESDSHCGDSQTCVNNACSFDGGDGDGDGDGSCSPPFDPCEALEDCCNYNGEYAVGSSDCVWFTENPDDKFCADVCNNHVQCDTGCCVEVGDTGLGVCLDSSFCI